MYLCRIDQCLMWTVCMLYFWSIMMRRRQEYNRNTCLYQWWVCLGKTCRVTFTHCPAVAAGISDMALKSYFVFLIVRWDRLRPLSDWEDNTEQIATQTVTTRMDCIWIYKRTSMVKSRDESHDIARYSRRSRWKPDTPTICSSPVPYVLVVVDPCMAVSQWQWWPFIVPGVAMFCMPSLSVNPSNVLVGL